MNFRILAALVLLLALLTASANAAPAISISFSGGDFGDNQLWTISVAPDPAIFVTNSSLAVEIDIQVTGQLIGATLNDDFWNVAGINPGNNPFTGQQALGLVVDTANDTIFVAAGSELFSAAAPIPLLTFETVFDPDKISWGGRTVLAGTPNEYTSSLVAQNGINFTGIVGETLCRPGDFSCSGSVGNDDLTLLLDNWGETVPPVPAGWIGIPPTPPRIGNNELTRMLDNWGEFDFGAGAKFAAAPEPGVVSLLAAAVAFLLVGRGRVREIP